MNNVENHVCTFNYSRPVTAALLDQVTASVESPSSSVEIGFEEEIAG